MTDQRPPLANIEAEQALLGALLVNNETLAALRIPIEPEHFSEGVHARIFEAIRATIGLGRLASPVTLFNYFQSDPALKELGVGAAYLARLAGSAATIINAPDYALTVFDLFLRRQGVKRIESALDDLYNLPVDETAATYLSQVSQDLVALSEDFGPQGRTSFTAAAAVSAALDASAEAYRNKGKLPGAVMTGIMGLDDKIGGMIPSNLIIVGARPSMGKTALGLRFAYSAAISGTPVLFLSLEMQAKELGHRILSMSVRRRLSIPFSRITKGQISETEYAILAEATRDCDKLPLIIDDRSGVGLSGVRSAIARAKTRYPNLAVVVVDYLGLMAVSNRYAGRRVDEVSELSTGLKTLAKEMKVAIVALHQLSRALENRENKRPTMADLRDSGAIEQDADIIIFPFREGYYIMREYDSLDPESSPAKELIARMQQIGSSMELIIAKNRQGPTTTVRAWCDVACNYIADAEPATQGVMEMQL